MDIADFLERIYNNLVIELVEEFLLNVV